MNRIFNVLIVIMGLSTAASAQVKMMSVNPTTTDPGIVSVHGDHVAYFDSTAKHVNKLLFMIVGTTAEANHNIPFFRFAAEQGYHVISIDYKNSVITTVCSNSEDKGCFVNFRQEIVFGEPVSSLVDVDSSNSIYNRFYKLLVYLSKQYPKQGWQQYLAKQSINWPKIIVAGHSQGAGHAAYFGKKFPVNRVLILAGPQDYFVRFSKPADWLSQHSATPADRYFSFLHVKDPYDYNKQKADCLAVMAGIKADTVLVQPNSPVSMGKRILVTNIETTNPHESMMQPGFEQAWAYLLSANPGK